MLLPVTLKNRSDEIQQNLKEEELKLTSSEDEIVDDNNNASSDEDTSKHEGPITRSRPKRVEKAFLLKANILMSYYFNDD